jgi:hypothetical protein
MDFTYLYPTLGVIVYLWIGWYIYVLVMGFYRAHLAGRLTPFARALAMPALIVGYTIDLLANWTIAFIVFAEPPEHPMELVTGRLTRYIKFETGYRHRWATWLCTTLLDYFDPHGTHCA